MSCINIVNGSLSFLYFEFDTNYIISTLSEYFFICYFDMNLDCNVSLYLIVIFELVILSLRNADFNVGVDKTKRS